jgi:hypothetical protein
VSKALFKIPQQTVKSQNKIPEKSKTRTTTVGKTSIPAKPKTVNFSFQFWRQIEYFSLNKSDLKWFVALLDKLTELSSELLDEFRSNRRRQGAVRYHPVKWDQKNIPIKRSDLTWLDKDYRDNEKEWDFYQIHITKGLGCMVGFWDEQGIFNIVLLDPHHNIYPTKRTGYRVDKCYPLENMYSSLIDDIRQTRQDHNCPNTGCSLQTQLRNMPLTMRSHFNIVLFHLSNEQLTKMEQLLDGGQCKTLDEILIAGIDYISA